MKRLTLFTVMAAFTIVFINSCAKTVEPVWMVYEEDNCKPPWVGKTDNRSRNNLEAVLRADGIIPLKIKIKGQRENDCTFCDCKTGKTYHVQIDESQLNWMFYYGFQAE